MVHARRLLAVSIFCALCTVFAPRAHADPLASGTFANDSAFFSYSFTTSFSRNYTFTTTSFAGGGFVPVLTLFDTITGGVPLAFAETDTSDVSLTQLLGPGSYILYLTEDPNVFQTTLAAGPLFASSPTVTGDLCGVSGGRFLDVFDGCSQRTSNFAATVTTAATTVTPEPATWLLLAPPAVFAFAMRRRALFA